VCEEERKKEEKQNKVKRKTTETCARQTEKKQGPPKLSGTAMSCTCPLLQHTNGKHNTMNDKHNEWMYGLMNQWVNDSINTSIHQQHQ
jgi:hypothetical protein